MCFDIGYGVSFMKRGGSSLRWGISSHDGSSVDDEGREPERERLAAVSRRQRNTVGKDWKGRRLWIGE